MGSRTENGFKFNFTTCSPMGQSYVIKGICQSEEFSSWRYSRSMRCLNILADSSSMKAA